jgi:hypothetical protein
MASDHNRDGDAGSGTLPLISAEEFDRRFDAGEDLSEYWDLGSVRRPGLEPRRVNVDFPRWVVEALDREAKRLGVSRQAVIKVWIADRLEVSSVGSV